MGAIFKGAQAEGWCTHPSALLSLQAWQGSRIDSEPIWNTEYERNQLAERRREALLQWQHSRKTTSKCFQSPFLEGDVETAIHCLRHQTTNRGRIPKFHPGEPNWWTWGFLQLHRVRVTLGAWVLLFLIGHTWRVYPESIPIAAQIRPIPLTSLLYALSPPRNHMQLRQSYMQ